MENIIVWLVFAAVLYIFIGLVKTSSGGGTKEKYLSHGEKQLEIIKDSKFYPKRLMNLGEYEVFKNIENLLKNYGGID